MVALVVAGFILGTVLGSFTKVWADRSIEGESILGRSYCPKCKKTLRWYDLFPILSYFLTGGKCRYCHKKISIQYPLIELSMGVLTAIIFWLFFPINFLDIGPIQQILTGLDVAFKVFAALVLTAIFLTDLETGYIYNRITYPAIVIALGYLILTTAFKIFIEYEGLLWSPLGKYLLPPHSDFFFHHAVWAADPLVSACSGAILLTLFFGGLIFITRGRGMGGGDLKLGIFLGLVLGFPECILAVFIAFMLGSFVGIGLIISQKKKFRQTIPFGPFLAIGGAVALFWGNQLVNFYYHISSL